MTKNEAKAVAQQLGDIPLNDEKLHTEIQRLNRKSFIPLQQVEILHDWLEGKRQSRQSGRVVGESRTGKTMSCDALIGYGINQGKRRGGHQLYLLLISKFPKSAVRRSCLG